MIGACPFCLHTGAIVIELEADSHTVSCGNCLASGPAQPTPDRAIAHWNVAALNLKGTQAAGLAIAEQEEALHS